VTTKWDLLNSAAMAGAREVLSNFEEQFLATYVSQFAKASVFRVAARDPEGNLEVGYGLAPLLQSWLKPAPQVAFVSPALPPLADEFDRLLIRRVG
jgi:hypothetical protein